jgi:catechol 2,3-dioxygenase-like lactoylglutathione lyase family enzyme
VPLIPARIDSVTLAVADLERSTAFYRDVMGFALESASEMVCVFDLGAVKLSLIDRAELLLETGLDEFPPAPGPVTVVVSVTRDEVDEHMGALERAGVRILAPASDTPLGPRIGYAADPDGHIWEIGCFD